MDFTKLSYSQITSLAEQLNSTANQMEAVLDKVKSLFNSVGTDDVWSGTAAAETKASFDEVAAKFPQFSESVREAYEYLLTVVQSYKDVDKLAAGGVDAQ